MVFRELSCKDTHGFVFHVKEWLPDTSPGNLVFLLHGLADHGGRFIHVAEAFVERGCVFIAPDLLGNGKSEGKRGHFGSFEQIMDDIDFLLIYFRTMWPGLPVILYGQSMGGNLALNYCLRRQPELAGVISSSPWLRLYSPLPPIVHAVGYALGKFFPSLIIPNGINARELSQNRTVSDAYEKDPLVHGKISLNTYRIITESGEWAISNATKLHSPLLLMHGSSDRITSIEASRQFSENSTGNCTFKTWEGLFHELHNEPEHETILEFIFKWMKTLRTTSE
jgi:alpha-beta hydrolase superfamily lysophospholipase